ncbi:D-hexose-6-phosphate mutarotase [Morganella psychrotolerans]|uniref:Putative glucose-6-phosphate 1-epimerase n=1 Tax=Morganella psychrotolerans TaxID=368603 RepID=A0A5M9RAF8_9GAMM|nr:D-hexose-6-phosphate mutarotase [Morganella psychrotolerans]KAA8717016.1 D-hexose-6-phosphate mutarotase [Morganella psychrotolerans]OBU08661.1 D-hexose-6-phosphate mutarotase [Morganella psychrotolerans]
MIERLLALPVVSPITPSLSQRQMGELPVIVIDHPKVRAAVSYQGAHVLAWQPAEAEHPGLWLSENSAFTPGVPVRGGIPICWPWFGPVQAPAHGFARTMQWDFTAHNENEDGVFLTFTLRDSAETRKIWPHEFTLIARIRLGETCEVELEAYGQYQATAALHSYFTVGDIAQISVTGLGQHVVDKLAQRETYTDDDKLIFQGRTDRIYTEPEQCSYIRDKKLKRTIEVVHFHHSDVVCWNPGAALSADMKDMTDDGYKTMVCVESARINHPMAPQGDKPSHLSVRVSLNPEIA